MSERIKAVYENGVFKPIEAVTVTEGEVVDLIFSRSQEKRSPFDIVRSIAEAGAADPSLNAPSDLSTHHDKYIYGEDNPE
jgi:predicted DNA-binding antitoxin AbrB/MazE fold protein